MGKFIISLDFELFWGIFDKYSIESKTNYFDNTLSAIPQMLSLFEKNEIHVTWATVGAVMADNLEELLKYYPSVLPKFTNKKLSATEFINLNKAKIIDPTFEKYFFAPYLVKLIKNTNFQEIGTHTYLHTYTLEEGQTIESFENDLIAAKKIAKNKFDIDIKSIVFPRNQYNDSFIETCINNGVINMRTNPSSWYMKPINSNQERLYHKILRTLDAYIPLQNTTFQSPISISTVKVFPSSRFLRPVFQEDYLYKLQIKRVLKEMSFAAKNKSNYHLWWHPHNFGNNKELSLEMLKKIINHFLYLKQEYNFISANMGEL
jgi:peptidoglycan/xylan/chitin deacetylase (PgdA/CDA1 family)